MNLKKKAYRNPKYLEYVRTLQCCICGAPSPSDAHHIIGRGHLGGMGTKAPDTYTMPVCRTCHQHIHTHPEIWDEQWEYIARTLAKLIEEGECL